MSNSSKADSIVYVVDDDSDIRDGLKVLLESVGIACVCFSSTREFLRSQPTEGPNCLILDVRLPGIGGLDLQDELTKAQIKTPIIFITGHGDIPMSVRAIKGGAVEFLTKPFREQDLLDAVRTALERDRKRRQREKSAHDLRRRFDSLTPRERDVMTLVTAGMTNKQVAAELGITTITVKVHRQSMTKKLDAKALADLVRMADALGLPRTIGPN